MFWSKKSEPPLRVVPAEVSLPIRELDGALEGAAGVLRAFGRHAFDIEDVPAAEIEASFERWATHVLARTPAPLEEGDAPLAPGTGRDWRSLVRFVGRQRQREKEHVVRSGAEMRGAIGTLVNVLGRASIEQGRSARKLRARVDRLKASVESCSIEELRKNALGVAEAVNQTLEEQDRRMEVETRALRAELSRLREDLDEAKTESSTDALTSLQNRRAFDVGLERAVALSNVMGGSMSLVMVDVDRFKSINDRHGHPFGDRVLKLIADVLARTFRRRGDVVARYGGEEFAVLLAETPQAEAAEITGRLLTAMRALRIEHPGGAFGASVSCGVGELRRGESGDELVSRVDRALYEAKQSGRDRAVEATSFEASVEGAFRSPGNGSDP
ncbi:MAG: diguanylate cyclase [Labilithrix sp.]|nr:diguanylate cyclase [Labilithrix sp.]